MPFLSPNQQRQCTEGNNIAAGESSTIFASGIGTLTHGHASGSLGDNV